MRRVGPGCRCRRLHKTTTAYAACKWATRRVAGNGAFAVVSPARLNPEVRLLPHAGDAYGVATVLEWELYRIELPGVTP